jgi:formylglycine-generating enzyme required for sulfatase activity
MIVVPAGRFVMGSPSDQAREPNEDPQHVVTMTRPFAVSKFELTFEDWDACSALSGCDPNISDNGWGRGRQPVINVSWEDAQRYVRWLSQMTGKRYRLLSEAEWEYAARAGSESVYPWGNEIGKGNANCDGCGSEWDNRRPAPVGSFAPNAFGLYGMIGNIWEWAEDCYHDNYDGAPMDGSPWTTGDCVRRVGRGGSWRDNPRDLRVAARSANAPDLRVSTLGFRIARTLE